MPSAPTRAFLGYDMAEPRPNADRPIRFVKQALHLAVWPELRARFHGGFDQQCSEFGGARDVSRRNTFQRRWRGMEVKRAEVEPDFAD
jgi:hypothetical protein